MSFKQRSPNGRFKFDAHMAAVAAAEKRAEEARYQHRLHVAALREIDDEALKPHWVEIGELRNKQRRMEEAWMAPSTGDLGKDRMLRASEFREAAM